MSFYFLDTSALVKRYHLELGTEIVDAVFAENNSTKMISDLGVIEFYSTFAKKVRTGELSDAAFHSAIRLLAQDFQDNVVEIKSSQRYLKFWDEEKIGKKPYLPQRRKGAKVRRNKVNLLLRGLGVPSTRLRTCLAR